MIFYDSGRKENPGRVNQNEIQRLLAIKELMHVLNVLSNQESRTKIAGGRWKAQNPPRKFV